MTVNKTGARGVGGWGYCCHATCGQHQHHCDIILACKKPWRRSILQHWLTVSLQWTCRVNWRKSSSWPVVRLAPLVVQECTGSVCKRRLTGPHLGRNPVRALPCTAKAFRRASIRALDKDPVYTPSRHSNPPPSVLRTWSL